MASPTAAANAYSSLARMLEAAGNAGKSAGATAGTEAGGPSFGTGAQGRTGECDGRGPQVDAQTVAMASGKANVMDVVTAVAETDVAVSTLVSVRDKVIQAYEDIMKMPI